MAVTKTKFINYSRCPRYVALDEVKKERLNADISYKDYLDEEIEHKKKELISSMIKIDEDGEEEDLIDEVDHQLEIMLPYYKKIEELAGNKVEELFGGKSIYALKTKDQKSFDFMDKGIKYLCYLDIYNESNGINVIEVKATTSNNFLSLTAGKRGEEKFSIFYKDKRGVFHLKEELENHDISLEMDIKDYNSKRDKLKEKVGLGKYIYDLSVQRMFIEQTNKEKINYYLAVLNHEYVFDGTYKNDEPYYDTSIISIFDFTKITEEMQEVVMKDKDNIEQYLQEMNAEPTKLGDFCEYKSKTKCKYTKICFDFIPNNNSTLSYIGGFRYKDEFGNTLKGLDLINDGYVKMMDIPESWITKQNHRIQRECLTFHKEYIDKQKINLAIKELKYPIYHLDFETFPSPLPRFKGEKCYEQSPFQFSLHIEKSPGVCDKEKDHYEFLSSDPTKDERYELTKALCEYIGDKGTVFAQNVGFEKGVIKKLSNIFPEFKQKLDTMVSNASDLLYIVKNNKAFYEALGIENAELINYYHENLSGSYSIKKTLPVFSDLKYADLDVKNGTEALVTYAKLKDMKKEEKDDNYRALIEYCKQDTWAMVVILNKLRKMSI